MKKFDVTREDVIEYLLRGGDFSDLASGYEKLLSQEDVNMLVSTRSFVNPDKRLVNAPQEVINRFFEIGGNFADFENLFSSLPKEVVRRRLENGFELTDPRKVALGHYLGLLETVHSFSQEDVNEIVRSGGPLDLILRDRIENVPQQYVNGYVEMGGKVDYFLPKQIDNLSEDVLIREIEAGNSGVLKKISDTRRKSLSDGTINKFVVNGGDIDILTSDEFGVLTEDTINKVFSGEVSSISSFNWNGNPVGAITVKSINNRAKNGCRLDNLNSDQIPCITEESVNIRASKGCRLDDLTPDQISCITEESWFKYIENGGDLHFLPEELLKDLPQLPFNLRVARRGDSLRSMPNEKQRAVPKVICDYEFDEIKGKMVLLAGYNENANALILYSLGKISKDDLPISIFVNESWRTRLLRVIKRNTTNKFNRICAENGFETDVPETLVKAFNEKLKQIEEDVEARMVEGVKFLTERQFSEERVQDEIEKMEW